MCWMHTMPSKVLCFYKPSRLISVEIVQGKFYIHFTDEETRELS